MDHTFALHNGNILGAIYLVMLAAPPYCVLYNMMLMVCILRPGRSLLFCDLV